MIQAYKAQVQRIRENIYLIQESINMLKDKNQEHGEEEQLR